jgi:TatD DNase family protein
MHPQIVGTAHADMALFERLLPKADFIGEVGLDGSPQYYKTLSQQEAILIEIVRLSANANGRPMSIHGVRAFKRVLTIIGEHDPRGVNRYALHWFTGTTAEARTGVELKCYFSVNEAMIASQRGREVIAALPSDAVLTETDGPFIKRHEAAIRPSMVLRVTEYLARQWNVTVQHAASQIRENFDVFAASAQGVAGGTDS